MHFRVVFLWFVMARECCGLDMKGIPKQRSSCLNSVPSCGATREGCGPFRRCHLSGGNMSPRWVSCFVDQSHNLFTLCFLIANVTWAASCSSPWPQFRSNRHAFSYCCQVFLAWWAVLSELEAKETSPPYVALVRCFWHNKREWPETVRCVDMVQGGDLIGSAVACGMKSIG